MKRIFLLLLVFCRAIDSSQAGTLIPARGHIKQIVMDAQNTLGIPKDQQAQVILFQMKKSITLLDLQI